MILKHPKPSSGPLLVIASILFSFMPLAADTSEQGIRQLTTGTVIPELWSIESKAEIISSKIDTIGSSELPCAPSPITTTGTISGKTFIAGSATLTTPGAYCLAQDIHTTDTGIIIVGDNITLDLNGYTIDGSSVGSYGIVILGNQATVKNGTIKNMVISGIRVEGIKNKIEACDLIDNTVGIHGVSTSENTIVACRALQNQTSGFLLENSQQNSFTQCVAIDTGASGDVLGFVSSGGEQNRFINCVAQNTLSTTTDANSLIAGFALTNGEMKSEIIGCTANTTQADSGTVLGIYVSDGATVLNTASLIHGDSNAQISTLSWLLSDSKNFLALAGAAGNNDQEIRVAELALCPFALTEVATGTHGAQVKSIDWNQLDTQNYLAVGGNIAPDMVNVRLFSFNSITNALDPLPTATFLHGSDLVFSVDWLQATTFLAVGGFAENDAPDMQILQFDPVNAELQSTATFAFDTSGAHATSAVSWLKTGLPLNYLAVAGGSIVGMTTVTKAQILAFDTNTQTLSLLPTATFTFANNITLPTSIDWLTYNSKNYLAVAQIGTSTTPSIYVFEFDTGTNTLSLVATHTYQSSQSTVASVSWKIVNNVPYLAAATTLVNFPQQVTGVDIFSFDPTLAQLTLHATIPTGPIFSNLWYPGNRNLLGIGVLENDFWQAQVLDLLLASSSSECFIKNNLVHHTTTACQSGIGIAANSTLNYTAANTSCDNDINYNGVASAYLDSQANARGVDNVDCSLSNIDDIAIISQETWSIESKTEVISSKLTTFADQLGTIEQENWSIESKAEVISSKCDGIALIPAQQPITNGTIARTALTNQTINQPGSYFLNENINGEINIVVGDVTLDLNEFAVTGTITIEGSNTTLKNGLIINNNIIATNSNILIENITMSNGSIIANPFANSVIHNCRLQGIQINAAGAASGIEISNCFFTTNGTGLSVHGVNNVTITDCFASNTIAPFDILNCNNVILRNCTWNNNAPSTAANAFSLAESNQVSLIGCDAENSHLSLSLTFSGFAIDACENVSLEKCSAKFFGAGFSLQDSSKIIITQCIAEENVNGFDLLSSLTNITVAQCVAESQRTSSNGFHNHDATNTGIIRECTAHAVTRAFLDVSSLSIIRYVANAAYGTGNSYDPDQTIAAAPFYAVQAQNPQATGLNYWNNIFF